MNVCAGSPGMPNSRTVADLTLPEALVIWALRKHYEGREESGEPAAFAETYHGEVSSNGLYEGSLSGLVSTFTKVFGNQQVSEAIGAFGEVIVCIDQGARGQIRINAYADECLSIHEEHFLSILDALQRAELERASMLVQWLIEPAYNVTFTRHAHSFARLLLKSGHSLCGTSAKTTSGKQRILKNRRDIKIASATQFEDLTLGETIILHGARRWVACLHQEQEPYPALQAHFAHYGIIDSAASLNAFFRNIAFAASRTVDIHGPSCLGVSLDEADLLHAVAGFQRSDSGPAYQALANWMPASAIRPSSGPLAGLADSLLAAGLILPLRERHAEDAADERHARCWRSGSDTLPDHTLH